MSSGTSPDLLSSLTNGLGGTTNITYTPSSGTAYANTNLPFILPTVTQIQTTDGRGTTSTTNYSYGGGYYYAPERDFRGFGYSVAYQGGDSSNYTAKTETWYNQDIGQVGVLKGTIGVEKVTSRVEGHTRQVINTYDSMSLGSGAAGCVPTATTPCFPRLTSAVSTVTDAGYTPYGYRTVYVYDPNYLNVTEIHKYAAATGTTADDVHTYIAYSNYTGPWIFKPTEARITDSTGAIGSRKWSDYNAITGNLMTEEVCISDTPNTGCLARNATQNAVTGYTYYPEGNIWTITNPRNATTTLTYDATKTFVNTATNALGHITTTIYDPGLGKITTLIPPHLQGTAYSFINQYDSFGRLYRENRPDGGWTYYQYLNLGNPNSQYIRKQEHIVGGTSTLDHYAASYFDGLGRSYWVSSTGPSTAPIILQTSYDTLGRVSTKSNPYLYNVDTPYYTTYTYDGLSRVKDILTPDNYHITTSYRGLTKVVTDQNNHTTTSTADVFGRLKRVQDHVGTITDYTYDTLGNLLTVVAAVGQTEQNTTSMIYDSASRKRSMTDPDMGAWSYSYDKSGNLLCQQDAKSQAVSFAYDGLNRLLDKKYYGSGVTCANYTTATPTSTVSNTYDTGTYAKGKLTSVTSATGSDQVLAFDVMQRVTSSQKTVDATSVTIDKTYDSAGRTYTMTYFPSASQRVFRYTYDAAGNITALRDNQIDKDIVQYTDFTALGQYKTAIFPKPDNVSVKTSYTYTPQTGRLHTLVTQKLVSGSPVDTYQDLDYQTFDGKGNLITLVDHLNNITHGYTYDSLDRLLTATGTGTNPYSQSYTYDRIGNIMSKSDVGSYSYLYGNRPHAVRTAGNISLQYDNNGNMTQRAVTSNVLDITYNSDNMPTGITKNSAAYLSYTYDGNGRRVKKQNLQSGNTALYFGESYEQRGSVGVMHLFTGSSRVASIRSDGNNQYYHSNHLQSASVITNYTGGNRKERLEYFPFGSYRERIDYDAAFPNANYTFTDQEDDDETGLLNYKARLYDPLLGRFLSADTVVPDPGNLQSLNRYSYCLNNPMIYVDPSGHWSLSSLLKNPVNNPISNPLGNLGFGVSDYGDDYEDEEEGNGGDWSWLTDFLEGLFSGGDDDESGDKKEGNSKSAPPGGNNPDTGDTTPGNGGNNYPTTNPTDPFENGEDPYVGSEPSTNDWFDIAWNYATEYGTSGQGLQPSMTDIEETVDSVFNNIAGREATVTYTTNGQHSPTSQHYSGNAVDLRTRDLSVNQAQSATSELRQNLGTNYTVINEGDHIHVQERRK